MFISKLWYNLCNGKALSGSHTERELQPFCLQPLSSSRKSGWWRWCIPFLTLSPYAHVYCHDPGQGIDKAPVPNAESYHKDSQQRTERLESSLQPASYTYIQCLLDNILIQLRLYFCFKKKINYKPHRIPQKLRKKTHTSLLPQDTSVVCTWGISL